MDAASNTPIPPATPGAFGRIMKIPPTIAELSRKGLKNRHRNERIRGWTRLSFRRWLAEVLA